MGYHYAENGQTYWLSPADELSKGTGPGDTNDQNAKAATTPTATATDPNARTTSNGGYYSVADNEIASLAQQATAAAGTLAAQQAKLVIDREIAQLQEAGAMSRTQATIAGQWAISQATIAGNLAMNWLDNEIKRQTTNASNRLQVLTLLKDLRGPRNAFQQQAVIHGLNAAGLSRAVDSLMGGATPSFQAPQAAPEPVTLDTFLNDTGAMLPGEIQQMPMPQIPGIPSPTFGVPGAANPSAGMMPGGVPGAFTAGAPAPGKPNAQGVIPNRFSIENFKTFSNMNLPQAFVDSVMSTLTPDEKNALAWIYEHRPDYGGPSDGTPGGSKHNAVEIAAKYGPAAAAGYMFSWAGNPREKSDPVGVARDYGFVPTGG